MGWASCLIVAAPPPDRVAIGRGFPTKVSSAANSTGAIPGPIRLVQNDAIGRHPRQNSRNLPRFTGSIGVPSAASFGVSKIIGCLANRLSFTRRANVASGI